MLVVLPPEGELSLLLILLKEGVNPILLHTIGSQDAACPCVQVKVWVLPPFETVGPQSPFYLFVLKYRMNYS